VAENEVRVLRNAMPLLEDHDAREQEMAMHGLEPTPDSELARLKKYEAACMRRKQWAYDRLMARKRMQHPNVHQGDRKPTPMPVEKPADPAPAPAPAPVPVPVPEDEFASIPEEDREFAVFNYFKQRDLARQARLKAGQAEEALADVVATPPPPAPPKPIESVRPASPQQFTGNRRARRAAAKKARQAGG
jgi:hypothetical protein